LTHVDQVSKDVMATFSLQDPEYSAACNLVCDCIYRGGVLAISKWNTYVQNTLEVCQHACYLNPYYMAKNFDCLPLSLPREFEVYGVLSSNVRLTSFSEWITYRAIVKNLNTTKLITPSEFWNDNCMRLQSLFKVAVSVLCVCPSAAEVERSFKKLRCILPKDHTRDTISEENVKYEMFFSFNREKIKFFITHGNDQSQESGIMIDAESKEEIEL